MRNVKEESEEDVYLSGLIAGLVEKHYEQLLKEIIRLDIELEDLVISYTDNDGRTIRMSWKEREQRLMERDRE